MHNHNNNLLAAGSLHVQVKSTIPDSVCMLAGNRFFWVGQRSRMSDSTDSSESSNLSTRALASQRSVNQQATFPPTSVPPSPFTSLHVPSHTASQPQSMPYKALPSLPRDKFSSMGCRPFDWSTSESSDRICSASALPSLTSAATAAAASDTFQDLAASESCIDSLQTFPSSPFETMIENMGLAEEEEMWAADCPPEDVDKLLDWAAAPSLSDPNRDSAHLDMPAAFDHSSARPGPQCTLAAGGHPSCTLGVHHDSSTTMAAAWACPAVARPQHESSSDELCYSQISALEAYAEAASQLAAAGPQRTASAQMGLTSDPLGLLEQTEAAAPLDGAGYPSLAMPSLSSRDSSPSSANEAQAGGSAQTDMQKKRRCGRPRVYDLDGPVTVGIVSAVRDYFIPHRSPLRPLFLACIAFVLHFTCNLGICSCLLSVWLSVYVFCFVVILPCGQSHSSSFPN